MPGQPQLGGPASRAGGCSAHSRSTPAPSLCSKHGRGGCQNHCCPHSAGCLSFSWTALGGGPSTHGHPGHDRRGAGALLQGQTHPHARGGRGQSVALVPRLCTGAGMVQAQCPCPALLLPAWASAGSTSPGWGSGCLRRAKPQRLPGWQAPGRAWSHPPATSPVEAPPSSAHAAASSVEPAGLRSRCSCSSVWGWAPGPPPQLGGAQPWPQPQPLPSLVAPLAPASKSGADVEARLGACLRLGAGSIGVAPFLPCSPLPQPHYSHEKSPNAP